MTITSWPSPQTPFFLAQAPGWADLLPFAYDTTSFRTPPPPVTSAEYTAAYNELKSYGRATGSSRTAQRSTTLSRPMANTNSTR